MVIIFANIETTLQVEKLREQGATQAQALQAAEAAAAQLVASQAEVETLREQSNSQLQAVETAEQELLAAQAEVSISGLFRVQSHEKYASCPELFGWFLQRLADYFAASLTC